MSVFLVECGQPIDESSDHTLDCKTWVNDSSIDFLMGSPEQKQMSSSLSNITGVMEENKAYRLYLREGVVVGPTSMPMADIQARGHKGTFSGFLFFKPEESGSYHVMVSQSVWIDFIDESSRQATSSTAYTEEKCYNDVINKVVQFPLEKGKRYIFYLVNAEVSSMKVAIRKSGWVRD